MLDQDALVSAAYELQPLPASIMRLARIVESRDADLRQIVELVSLDQGLTGSVLRLANSAASATGRQISLVRDAVLRVGGGTLLSLAVGQRVRGQMSAALPAYDLAEGELWRHSVAAALATERAGSVCRAGIPPEAFTAALLHDVGKLVLVRFLSRDLQELLERARSEGHVAALEAEREILGVDHAELGELVVQHWGLPDAIARPIAAHHAPTEDDGPVADAVHLADVIAKRIGAG